MSTEFRDEWITSLNLFKLKLYKGYCGEILGYKKENYVIVNSSVIETNKTKTNNIIHFVICFVGYFSIDSLPLYVSVIHLLGFLVSIFDSADILFCLDRKSVV